MHRATERSQNKVEGKRKKNLTPQAHFHTRNTYFPPRIITSSSQRVCGRLFPCAGKQPGRSDSEAVHLHRHQELLMGTFMETMCTTGSCAPCRGVLHPLADLLVHAKFWILVAFRFFFFGKASLYIPVLLYRAAV